MGQAPTTLLGGYMELDRTTCDEFVTRLPDLLDGEVDRAGREALTTHLDTCQHCLEIYTFERATIAKLRDRLRAVEVPNDLVSRVGALIARLEGGG